MSWKNPLCWWVGCRPDPNHPAPPTPCTRCGSIDISYDDLVGETRANSARMIARRYLLRWWLPEKCPTCGHRYSCGPSCDDIPF